MRTLKVFAAAATAISAAILLAPRAFADSIHNADWSAHPGAAIAGMAGLAVLAFAALVGLGCAIAVLGIVAPSIRCAMDRHARSSSPAWATVVGVLVGLGVVAAASGARLSGSHIVSGVVVLLLAIPAMLLGIAGSLATVPLLGERVLGRGGVDASPLRLAVTGSVVLGFAALAGALVGAVFHPAWALAAAVILGWPLGVAIGCLASAIRGRRAAPPAGSPPAIV